MAAGAEQSQWSVANLAHAVANKEYIERLGMVISTLHKCRATHVTSVYVKEEFQSQAVWEGDVEVFSIFAHPKANYCYGWSYGEPEQFMTVLEIPPVDSPQAAVKVGIAHQANQAIKQK